MNSIFRIVVRLFLCALLGICSITTARAGYLYALADDPAGSRVYGFRVNEITGALTLLPGFPVATGATGSNANVSERMAIDKARRRLYVINDGSDSVTAYSINPSTGVLTALPFSPIALGAGTWNSIAIHPSGSPLVLGDGNTTAPRVLSFQITATTATPAAGSPYTTGSSPAFSATFSPDGNYYYGGGNMGALIGGFSVNAATGVLTALPGAPFSSVNGNPIAYAMDPTGRLFTVTTTPDVRVFTSPGGILTPVTGNPFPATGLGATQRRYGLVHRNGFYLVAGNSGNNVASFQISGSGAATTVAAVTGSPFASGGTTANAIALNKSEAFLYLANRLSRNLTTYGVNPSSGVLTNLGVQPSNTMGTAGFICGIAYLPEPNNQSRADFDGDGQTDLSVFRSDTWHILRSTLGSTSVQWGNSGDSPDPSDYDGDGRADITVRRPGGMGDPTRSFLYILQSSTGTLRAEQFGSNTDFTWLTGDWDGDGKADPSSYRSAPPSPCGGSSVWYFRPSASPGVDFRYICWGLSLDRPLNGDFDGDGMQDAAVLRPSDGFVYIRESSTGQLRTALWGSGGDALVPADYDGDGRTDLAAIRQPGNVWLILNSSTGQSTAVTFGLSTDTPVPGDYDGDGRDDIAVFRRSDGTWHRINSSNGSITSQVYGMNGDYPVPTAFFEPMVTIAK